MVTIKFIGEASMMSKGITFENGGVYEVSDVVAEYLAKTFKNVEVIKSDEPKVVSKPKAK